MDEQLLRTVRALDSITRDLIGGRLPSRQPSITYLQPITASSPPVTTADAQCGPDEAEYVSVEQQTGESPRTSQEAKLTYLKTERDIEVAPVTKEDPQSQSQGGLNAISNRELEDAEAVLNNEGMTRVEQLWHEAKADHENRALSRARKTHERWRREKKSLEQCIQESLVEYSELFEKAEAIRIQVFRRSPSSIIVSYSDIV